MLKLLKQKKKVMYEVSGIGQVDEKTYYECLKKSIDNKDKVYIEHREKRNDVLHKYLIENAGGSQ